MIGHLPWWFALPPLVSGAGRAILGNGAMRSRDLHIGSVTVLHPGYLAQPFQEIHS